MTAPDWASIGDHGVLNTKLPQTLSSVWIDRDLSWLDFNQRVSGRSARRAHAPA